MYMQRIELPAPSKSPGQSRDTPAALLLKIVCGLIVLTVSAAVVVPYLAVMVSYMVAGVGLHHVKTAGIAVYQTVVYTGGLVTGR